MSEACQPTLRYGGANENPGVSTGTTIEVISSSPVNAVTVTIEVISVPELVMNCFEPLMTQWSPSWTAFVRVAP